MFIIVRGGFKEYQKILDLVAKSLEYLVQTKQKKIPNYGFTQELTM